MASDTRGDVARAAAIGDLDFLQRIAASEGIAAVRLDNDPQELTSLHMAAAAGQMTVVEYLLSPAIGADPRAARMNEFTPLHAAAMKGHAAICEVLLRAGASVNIQTKPQGYAPLHSAAFAGHVGAIKVLLANGANRDLLNYRNERPADTAKRQGQAEAVELLEQSLN